MVPTRWSHSPHGKASMTVVWQMFPKHVVSRFGDVPWPPRSPDLSACDLFLSFGLPQIKSVRSKTSYSQWSESFHSSKKLQLPQEMLINEMQNFEERLRTWVWQEGRHLSDIIFRNWVINGSNQNCIYYRLLWCWHNFFIMKINKVTIIWKTCVLFAPHCIYDYLHICEILIECGMNERMNRWMNE